MADHTDRVSDSIVNNTTGINESDKQKEDVDSLTSDEIIQACIQMNLHPTETENSRNEKVDAALEVYFQREADASKAFWLELCRNCSSDEVLQIYREMYQRNRDDILLYAKHGPTDAESEINKRHLQQCDEYDHMTRVTDLMQALKLTRDICNDLAKSSK